MGWIEWAAHVEHHVTHDSRVGQIGLGIAGVIIATTAAVMAAPATITAAVVLTAVGAVGSYGSLGMDIGKIVDGFIGTVEAGKLVTGLPTVKLGPDRRDAARAFTDSKTDCHEMEVAQGSKIVMMGPERRPMSRRGDKLRCANGLIAEGLKTLFVGGEASETGQQVEDGLLSGMSTTFAWLSIIKSVGTGAVRESLVGIGQQVAAGTGNEAAAGLIGLGGLSKPSTTGWRRAVDWADAANTSMKGAASGVDLATKALTP